MKTNNLANPDCQFDEDRILVTSAEEDEDWDILVDDDGNVLVTEC